MNVESPIFSPSTGFPTPGSTFRGCMLGLVQPIVTLFNHCV